MTAHTRAFPIPWLRVLILVTILLISGCTAQPAPTSTQAPPPVPTDTPAPTATSTPVPPPKVTNLVLAEGVDEKGQPVGAGLTFGPLPKAVHAVFTYSGFVAGGLVTYQWLMAGETRQEKTEPWDKPPAGTASASLISASGLAGGSYEFRISLAKTPLASQVFTITSPATATPTPTNTPLPAPTATATRVAPTAPPAPPAARGRIAYTSFIDDKDRGYEIYIMNADGTGAVKMCTWCSEPSFNPDGSRLVFYSWDKGGLFTSAPSAGAEWKSVLKAGVAWPIWSPDGGRIAFTGVNQNKLRVFVMNSDGSGLRIVSDGQQGTWAPDSSRLVFKSCDGGSCGLFIVNADGSGRRQITTGGNDSSPDWSPDGSKIAFGSDRDGNWEIYTVSPGGGAVTRLTNSRTSDGIPVWSPDSRRIAFRSDRSGVWAVYTMNADGSGVVKLVDAAVQLSRWDYERLSWTKQ